MDSSKQAAISAVRETHEQVAGFWWEKLVVGNEIVGTVSFSLSEDGRDMTLDKLFVQDGHRRRGYGGRLIEHVCEWARRLNCDRVALTVSMANGDAIRLYRRHGFTVKSIFLGDSYIMVRSL